MTTGSWKERVAVIADQAKDEVGDDLGKNVLKQGGRRRDIIRKKLMLTLSGRITPVIKVGDNAHASAGREIDLIIEAMNSESSKDGVDLDPELIEMLIEMSSTIHAIQTQWKTLERY